MLVKLGKSSEASLIMCNALAIDFRICSLSYMMNAKNLMENEMREMINFTWTLFYMIFLVMINTIFRMVIRF